MTKTQLRLALRECGYPPSMYPEIIEAHVGDKMHLIADWDLRALRLGQYQKLIERLPPLAHFRSLSGYRIEWNWPIGQ